jgi:hypothetical protein
MIFICSGNRLERWIFNNPLVANTTITTHYNGSIKSMFELAKTKKNSTLPCLKVGVQTVMYIKDQNITNGTHFDEMNH